MVDLTLELLESGQGAQRHADGTGSCAARAATAPLPASKLIKVSVVCSRR